ncbi:CBS domain-containing protein [[Eubacterium] cellulosolvens]
MSSTVLVRDIMSKNMRTARADSKLREVIQKMVKFHISSIIVIERDKPVGIITERDFLRELSQTALDLDVVEAKDVMSRKLITVDEASDIGEASQLMLKNNIKKLPVVNNGKLVGIITSSDILRGTNMMLSSLKDICMIGKLPEKD